jgi:hypothetical protein
MRPLLTLLIATCATFFGACATQIPSPQPSWKQATGQVQSRGGSTPIVGEIAIRYDEENFLAEITKGPSLPLLKIYGKGPHAEEVTLRGVLARGSWHGSPSAAPEALQAWVALPEVFHWANARKEGDRSYNIQLQGIKTGGRREGDDLSYLQYTRGGEEIIVRLQH